MNRRSRAHWQSCSHQKQPAREQQGVYRYDSKAHAFPGTHYALQIQGTQNAGRWRGNADQPYGSVHQYRQNHRRQSAPTFLLSQFCPFVFSSSDDYTIGTSNATCSSRGFTSAPLSPIYLRARYTDSSPSRRAASSPSPRTAAIPTFAASLARARSTDERNPTTAPISRLSALWRVRL